MPSADLLCQFAVGNLKDNIVTPNSMLVEASGGTFYVTDHYLNHPFMLVKLSAVRRADLEEQLEQAWELAAPPRLRAQRSS